jgi:glycosyltransferase involved in cell wall biosynthesis
MKTLLLNRTDIEGGAARAAYRLHTGLNLSGIDSKMLVGLKFSDDITVIAPKTKLEKGMSILSPILDTMLLGLYRKRERIIFSPAIIPENIAKKVSLHNPDLIHLHWIAEGFLRIETLRKFQKPIIWTLHDMWAFTGGCHYDNSCGRYKDSCGRCPQLNSKKPYDISYWIMKRKKRAWKHLNITIVTPSKWLAESAKNSSLFKNHCIEVIPYGIDTKRFKPFDKKIARDILSLPQNKKLILFGAMQSMTDKRKGFLFLDHAMQSLVEKGWFEKIELIVFGASKPFDKDYFGLQTTYMGQVKDDVSLALLYAAADVFIAPSIQENMSNAVMEALSCGTPCVAFNIGGMPEMIVHENTGYLAKPFDPEDLAKGIEWIIEDEKRWNVLSQQARQKVEKEFKLEIMAQEYLDLYNEVLIKSSDRYI